MPQGYRDALHAQLLHGAGTDARAAHAGEFRVYDVCVYVCVMLTLN